MKLTFPWFEQQRKSHFFAWEARMFLFFPFFPSGASGALEHHVQLFQGSLKNKLLHLIAFIII